MLPNFLVIGAPRAGTTWIDENLRRHPEVFLPQKKELHFFDLNFEKGMEYYEAFFSAWRGQKAVGEATPAYLHGAYSKNNIPHLIRQSLPRVKLIASLRHPVERAYSRYLNSFAKYDHNIRLSFHDKLLQKPEFIQEGYYFRQLQPYFELFPRDDILVLLYDDMQTDPKGFMRRIYEFIEVDPDMETGFEGARINMAAGKRNLARSKLLWLASRGLSRLNFHTAATRLKKFNSKAIPPLDPALRQQLADVYREENAKLQELIGRDLSAWNS